MAYTIAKLIYGIPLLEDVDLPFPIKDGLCFPQIERKESLLNLILDKNIEGLLTYYSGNTNTIPFAFGIEIDEYEEHDNFYDLKKEKIQITKELEEQFDCLFNVLPDNLKSEIRQYGTPRLCFIWSTS